MSSNLESDLSSTTVATAGTSNAVSAGALFEFKDFSVGTINIITLTNAKLQEPAFINAVVTATEAKTMALIDIGIKSFVDNCSWASGTTSDAIVIATTGTGSECNYAGTATDIGQLIGYTVKNAVKKAVKNYQRHAGLTAL